MPNPNVQHNVVMKITTYDAKPDPRYMLIPYFLPRFNSDVQWYAKKVLKFDREGMVYTLGTYFTLVNAIQCPHWFQPVHGIFGAAALMVAYIAQIAAFCAIGSIIPEWIKGRKI